MIGKFITLEGGEGVGKTTQIEMLVDKLRSLGIEVENFREPGGTAQSEALRNLLMKNSKAGDWDPISEALIIFASRKELLRQRILPALESGKWVICDRFYDSTIVYQGIMKKANIEHIMMLKRIVMEEFEPDLTILLDLPATQAFKRVEKRSTKDYLDPQSIDNYEIVRNGFKELSEIFSFRTEVVKASGSSIEVFERIFSCIEKRLLANEAS